MLTFLLLSSASLAQPCAEPTSTVELAQQVAAAEGAFASMDASGFAAAEQNTTAMLTCLGEAVSPIDAVGVHRVQALGAFVRGDMANTEAAWRAVLSIQPAWTLPETMAPPGTPLRVAFQNAASAPPSTLVPLPAPPDLALFVDGARADTRPKDRPIVLQAQSLAGAVSHTTWLARGAPLPGWAEGPPAKPAVAEGPKPEERPPVEAPKKVKPPKVPKPPKPPRARTSAPPLALAATAVGTGLAASIAYGYAWGGRARYLDESTPMRDLDGVRNRTNGAVIVAGGLGAVAIGTGVAVGITW